MNKPRFVVLVLGLMLGLVGFSPQAQAQCFSSEVAPAQLTSAGEKTFLFKSYMHLCDGNGHTSGHISNAVVLIVREQREILKAEKPEMATVLYFELNYEYWNGSGTWAGWQPVILTVQDKNHKDLLPSPMYYDNTPRAACHYGRTVPFRYDGPLTNIFDQVEFVTIQIPRVTGIQHECSAMPAGFSTPSSSFTRRP